MALAKKKMGKSFGVFLDGLMIGSFTEEKYADRFIASFGILFDNLPGERSEMTDEEILEYFKKE